MAKAIKVTLANAAHPARVVPVDSILYVTPQSDGTGSTIRFKLNPNVADWTVDEDLDDILNAMNA